MPRPEISVSRGAWNMTFEMLPFSSDWLESRYSCGVLESLRSIMLPFCCTFASILKFVTVMLRRRFPFDFVLIEFSLF